MDKQSIEILYAVKNYIEINNGYSKRLVIDAPRSTALMSDSHGPFLSFEDLTSEDFFEIYRYKKSLEKEEKEKQ